MFYFLLHLLKTTTCPGWNTNNVSPKTPNGTFCFQNGNCTSNGVCDCYKDHYTFNCRKTCNNCSSHGTCSTKKGCVCDKGFVGDTCEYTTPQKNNIIHAEAEKHNRVCIVGEGAECTLATTIETKVDTDIKLQKTNVDVDMFIFGLQNIEPISSMQLEIPPALNIMLYVNNRLFYPILKSGNGIKITHDVIHTTTTTHHLKKRNTNMSFDHSVENVIKKMLGSLTNTIEIVVGKKPCDIEQCNNAGFCTVSGTCVCISGWTGETCAKKGQSPAPDTTPQPSGQNLNQYKGFDIASSTAMGFYCFCIFLDGYIKKKKNN